ncbi:hypothetical protein EXIGLDRAFT_835722 [Exidia glandulosa HHB12029]|uniref:MYND-type domain-containing protein n=1 Tax=Exidia glandulosa HHB12029 TaxID=1314781 RepID=A0A165IHT2_EXIGL|nr:hypothetical protein EXIGLDRAFT_835722 [Exidia glandulosa HHB12029]
MNVLMEPPSGMSRLEFADYNLARAVSAVIRDRDQPTPALCLPAVGYALGILMSGEFVPKALRTTYAEFVDTALGFVTTPLPAARFDRLQTKWSVCRCNMSHHLLRSVHPEPGKPHCSLAEVVIQLISVVALALEHVQPTKLQKSASQGKGPPSASHLIPRGPQSLVDVMLQWTEYTERQVRYQTLPLAFLTQVSTFCPSLRRPMWQSSALLQSIATRWKELAIALECLENKSLHQYPDPPTALDLLFDIGTALSQAVLEFTPDLEEYFTPQAHVLFAAAERVMAALPMWSDVEGSCDQMRELVERTSRTFWMALPADERPLRVFPSWDRVANSLSFRSFAYASVSHWGRLNACAGPSCTVRGESATEPLRVCQRCKTLRYCSRGCQKEHWKWSTAPHKTSCAMVGKCWAIAKRVDKAELDGLDMYELFIAQVEEAGYASDDVMVAVRALEALTKAKENH